MPKILVMDDDKDILKQLRQFLAPLPYEFEYYSRGTDVLSAVFTNARNGIFYDLFILDCAMPILDGYTVAEVIRVTDKAYGRRSKIALLTAFSKTVKQEGLVQKVEADAYWTKPEDVLNLRELIPALLGA